MELELLKDIMLDVRTEVKTINRNGCAKREGDLNRLSAVDKKVDDLGSKLDKLFWTTLLSALGILAFFIKAFIVPVLVKLTQTLPTGVP